MAAFSPTFYELRMATNGVNLSRTVDTTKTPEKVFWNAQVFVNGIGDTAQEAKESLEAQLRRLADDVRDAPID